MSKDIKKTSMKKSTTNTLLTILLSILSVIWILPVVIVLMNSFKTERGISTNTIFQLPTASTFAGFDNYSTAINNQGFGNAFLTSLVITLTSLFLILLCCSMTAWFITRVKTWWTKTFYYLFVFSMVVPFQMLMFTLASTADKLGLNKPYNIAIIYLGFGAGLAVFMIAGFVKSIPLEIEEAAMMDGCNPIRTFFSVVLPILKPTLISVGILEAMWLWNDYLLPYLVLDRKKYQTIPILVQYFQGSFGKVEMGPSMASIILSLLPIIILYIFCQKYIVEGVIAGAVKG